MIIGSAAPRLAATAVTKVASAAVNVATFGAADAALTRTREAEAQAAERRTPAPPQDTRLTGNPRSVFEQKLAEIGGSVEDKGLRYGNGTLEFELQYTLARAGGIEVMLMQIDRQTLDLADATARATLDLLVYALRTKTVRIFQPELNEDPANFFELKTRWLEDEDIRVDLIPNHYIKQLEENKATLAAVLRLDLKGGGAAAAPGSLITEPTAPSPGAVEPTAVREIRVFVSYSHWDKDYVLEKSPKSLLAYLKGTLQYEGYRFWWDGRLNAGDLWDDEIRRELGSADIALVLVSQSFLNSRYCRDVEIRTFLAKRDAANMIVFPVLVAPSEWKEHGWLYRTQHLPPDEGNEERNLRNHYTERGKRETLYLEILKELRAQGQRIREPHA